MLGATLIPRPLPKKQRLLLGVLGLARLALLSFQCPYPALGVLLWDPTKALCSFLNFGVTHTPGLRYQSPFALIP